MVQAGAGVIRHLMSYRLGDIVICRLKAGLLVAGLVALSAQLATADEIPAFWAKSMVNDPAKNYYVAQAMKPLDNPDAQTLRVIKLADALANLCAGASFNKKALYAYMTEARFAEIKGDAFNEAAFLADSTFRYFDYRALAHLCAGSAYLFGPEGHLAKGVLKPGKGKPKASYDPSRPFVGVPPIARKS
jgi:hypothetical protein